MKKPFLAFKSCAIKPSAKLFPRICIGHIALFLTGVFLVIMELMN
ncbi:hypothetical protein [Sporosarcina koreensis]|uniref:Uncharacterized protein n=1 Tax=Sporosarcina koreensis TaxID=334735 RepID=A0ABW0U278_9BACL